MAKPTDAPMMPLAQRMATMDSLKDEVPNRRKAKMKRTAEANKVFFLPNRAKG